jgi:hypothetical protein
MEETNPTNPTTNSTEPIIKGESGTGTSNGESGTVPQTKIEKNVVECRIKFQASDRLRFEDGMKLGQALIDLKLEVGHGDFEKRYKELGVTKEVARTWMKKARGMYKDRHKKKEEAIFTWEIGQGWLITLENKAAIHMRTDPGGSDKLVGETLPVGKAARLPRRAGHYLCNIARRLNRGENRGRRRTMHGCLLQRLQQACSGMAAVSRTRGLDCKRVGR